MVKVDDLLHQFVSILFSEQTNISKDKLLKKMLYSNIKEQLNSWTKTIDSWKGNIHNFEKNSHSITSDSKVSSSYLEDHIFRGKRSKYSDSKGDKDSNEKQRQHLYSENSRKIKFDDEIFEKMKLWENGFDKDHDNNDSTSNERNHLLKLFNHGEKNSRSRKSINSEETISSKKSPRNSKGAYYSNQSISKNSSRVSQNYTCNSSTENKFGHSNASQLFHTEMSYIAPTISYYSQNGSSIYCSNDNYSSKQISPMRRSSKHETKLHSTITCKKDKSVMSNSSDRSDFKDSIAINHEILDKLEELSNQSSKEKESESISNIRNIWLKYREKVIDGNKIEFDSNDDGENSCNLSYKFTSVKKNQYNNNEMNEGVRNNEHIIMENIPNDLSSKSDEYDNNNYNNDYEKTRNNWDNKYFGFYPQNIQNSNISENIIQDGTKYRPNDDSARIKFNEMISNNIYEKPRGNNHTSLKSLRSKKLRKISEPFQQQRLAPESNVFIPNTQQQNKYNESPMYRQNVYVPTNNYTGNPVTNHCNIGQYNIITTNSSFINSNQHLLQSNNGQVFHQVSGNESQTNINQINNANQTTAYPNQTTNAANTSPIKTPVYNVANNNDQTNAEINLNQKINVNTNINLPNNASTSFNQTPSFNNNDSLKKIYEAKNPKIEDPKINQNKAKFDFESKSLKQAIQESKISEQKKVTKVKINLENKVPLPSTKKDLIYENFLEDLDNTSNIQQTILDTDLFLNKQKQCKLKTSNTIKLGPNEFRISKCERKKLKKEKKKVLKEERKIKKNINEIIRFHDKSKTPIKLEILEENLSSPLYEQRNKNEIDQLIEKYKSVKNELINIIKSQNNSSRDTNQAMNTQSYNTKDIFDNDSTKMNREYFALDSNCRNNDMKLLDNDLECLLQENRNSFTTFDKSSYIKDQLKTYKKIQCLKMKYVNENNLMSKKAVKKQSYYRNFNFVNRDFELSLEKINNRIKNIYAKFVKNKDITSKNKQLFQKIVDEYLELKNYQFLEANVFIKNNEKIYRDQVNDLEKSIKEDSSEFNDSNSFDFLSEYDKTNYESENRLRYLIESIQENIVILEDFEQNSPSIKFNLQSLQYIKNFFKGNNAFFIFNDYFDFVSKMETRKDIFNGYDVIYVITYYKMKNSILEAITFATEDFVIALNMNFGIKKSEKVKEMISSQLSDPKKIKVTIDVKSTIKILNKNLDIFLSPGSDWYDAIGVADSVDSIKSGKLFLDAKDGTNTLLLEQLSLRYLNECIDFSQQIEWNNLSYFSNEYQCKKIYTNLLALMQIYKHQISYAEQITEAKEYLKEICFSLDEIIKQTDGRFLFDNSMKKGYMRCQNIDGLKLNISLSNKDANYYRMLSTAKNECRLILTNDSVFAYIFRDTKLILLIDDEMNI